MFQHDCTLMHKASTMRKRHLSLYALKVISKWYYTGEYWSVRTVSTGGLTNLTYSCLYSCLYMNSATDLEIWKALPKERTQEGLIKPTSELSCNRTISDQKNNSDTPEFGHSNCFSRMSNTCFSSSDSFYPWLHLGEGSHVGGKVARFWVLNTHTNGGYCNYKPSLNLWLVHIATCTTLWTFKNAPYYDSIILFPRGWYLVWQLWADRCAKLKSCAR